MIEKRFKKDVERIVELVRRRAGVKISEELADKIWRAYSDTLAAGWLGLDEDDNSLMTHIEIGVDALL